MCVRASEKGRERGKSLGDKLTLCNSGEEGKKGSKDPLTFLLLLLGECPSNYVFYTFIDLRCLIFELQLWICIFLFSIDALCCPC